MRLCHFIWFQPWSLQHVTEKDENMLICDVMILHIKYQNSQWDPWDCMLFTSFAKSGVLSAVAMRCSCFVCSSLSATLCLFLMSDSLENTDSQAYELPNITRSRHPTWLKLEYFSITSRDDKNENLILSSEFLLVWLGSVNATRRQLYTHIYNAGTQYNALIYTIHKFDVHCTCMKFAPKSAWSL